MKHFYQHKEAIIGIVIDATTLGLLISLILVLNAVYLKL